MRKVCSDKFISNGARESGGPSMKIYIDEDELWPVYEIYREQAPEKGADRLEIDAPAELIKRYANAKGAFFEALTELHEIVEPIKEATGWLKWPFESEE